MMAFSLRLHKDIKDGNKLFVFTHDIPTIIQFLAVVALILADYWLRLRYNRNVWNRR